MIEFNRKKLFCSSCQEKIFNFPAITWDIKKVDMRETTSCTHVCVCVWCVPLEVVCIIRLDDNENSISLKKSREGTN